MITWRERPLDEANLFNPAFCAWIVLEAVKAYSKDNQQGLPFAITFLIPPIVLHLPTRASLPTTTRTHVHVWLQHHPEARLGFADRATSLVPIVREALLFGMQQGALAYSRPARLLPGTKRLRGMAAALRESTEEVRDCIRRASFVGRWFGEVPSVQTLLGLWGVRP